MNLQVSTPCLHSPCVKNYPRSANYLFFPFLFLLPSLPPLLHIFLSSSSLHLSSLPPPLPSSSPLLPSFCFVLSSSKTNPRHHISPRNTSAGLRACTHNLCVTCPSWEREWTRIEQPRASLTCLHPLAKDPGMSSASRGDPPSPPRGCGILLKSSQKNHIRSASFHVQTRVTAKRETAVKSVDSGTSLSGFKHRLCRLLVL